MDDEYRLSELTPLQADEVILDVGANIGLFTLAIADIYPNSTIYSFEPNPDRYCRLLLNLVANHASRAIPVGCAVYSGSGRRRFNAMGATTSGALDDQGAVNVNCTTIDEFCTQRAIFSVGILKIDIEGAEVEALRGAKRTLDFTRYVIVECHSKSLVASVAAMLEAAGFRAMSEGASDSGGGVLRYQRDLPAAPLKGNRGTTKEICYLDRLPGMRVETTDF